MRWKELCPSGVIFRKVKARLVAWEGQYSFSNQATQAADNPMRAAHKRQAIRDILDEIKAGVDEFELSQKIILAESMLKGRLDNVVENTQESLMRLKNLQAQNYQYPRLVAVEEVASGCTPWTAHGMKTALSKILGLGEKDLVVHFLCPVDMTKVPCGYGGEGYRFRETRGWVKKISPVLQVAVVIAKARAMAGLNVDISDFLKDVKDALVHGLVDRNLDEEALLRAV